MIARENLLYTYIDYYLERFKEKPYIEDLKEIAEIISWNFFQMDGIKFVIPNSCKNELEIDHTLFGEQRIKNDINSQVDVVKYSSNDWKRLSEFAVNKHLVSPIDVSALAVACKIPAKIPNAFQSKRLLDLLERAIDEGFKI